MNRVLRCVLPTGWGPGGKQAAAVGENGVSAEKAENFDQDDPQKLRDGEGRGVGDHIPDGIGEPG